MSRPGSLGGNGYTDQPKFCNGCGQWPAPIRPDNRLAYCEACAKEVKRGPQRKPGRA